MQYDLVLVIPIAVLLIIQLLLRTNSAVVFFSLCAGSLLATQLGGEVSLIGSSVIKNGEVSNSVAYIGLIVLPALLSALFMRKTANFALNIIPAIAVAGMAVVMVVPLLPQSIREEMIKGETWNTLNNLQPIILSVGVISSIAALWLGKPKSKKHKKK